MRQLIVVALSVVVVTTYCVAQDFSPTPVVFKPDNLVEFKMNLPITHLDVNNYVPSSRGIYAGQAITFHFFNRNSPWTDPSVFMRVRWDADLDSRNGVAWSDWFEDNNEDAFATVRKTFAQPGSYTIVFEIEFYLSDGSQAYSRQKEYALTVVPMPTAVYQDSHNNKLFYWVGQDAVCNKPVFVVEGFDPDNSNTAAVNYGLGFDVIELGRSQGYDVYILEFADGGADMDVSRDVFLGGCRFLHGQLQGADAALQIVGMSMGGTVA